MPWIVRVFPAAVPELQALPDDVRARFLHIVEQIQAHGLERMREPHVKHLDGKL